jgi:hypothetical protein
MYLVELRPGKEELYRTGEELAAAIRVGDVDVHSRIYHRATSKWISVTLHPHYKTIAAEREAAASTPQPTAEPRESWSFFNAASETLAGANDTQQDLSSAANDGTAVGEEGQHPWRRPTALSVTGLLMILGMQLAFFGPRPPWASHKPTADLPQVKTLPATAPSEAPSQSLVSLAGTAWLNGDHDVGGASRKPRADTAAPDVLPPAPAILPPAPAIHLTTLSQVLPAPAKPAPVKGDASPLGGFLARWSAAHDEARSRLQSGIRVARLDHLFSPARLTPNGGVTETRMAIAGAANFIRVYRQQREVIDREFQDSFVVMSREQKLSASEVKQWYTRMTPQEIPALTTLTSTILTGMDSLLGVLDAQAGAYKVDKATIHFEDLGAARAYGELRQEISKAVDVAKASGGADSTGPIIYLLEAIGSTRLPQES